MNKLLDGFTVLDCGQFLSAPSAALRLADLGAHVIKVEKPETGDICRNLYISNVKIDEDSSIFHAINRNKDGITLDLKNQKDQNFFETILRKVDIVIVNFRPGVTERLHLDPSSVHTINPKIIYGEITGYGTDSPWSENPGQDLLVQGLSGICYLNGDASQPPLPFGLSIADLAAGEHLIQGILAALYSAQKTGKGAIIQVDLLSSLMDLQFESFTTYLNDGHQLPVRSSFHNANPYLGAPYGIYQTKNGFLAISMTPILPLAKLLQNEELIAFLESHATKKDDDKIKKIIQKQLLTNSTEYWLSILEPHDIWCTKVLNWNQMEEENLFSELDMLQEITTRQGTKYITTRCPIRVDGKSLKNTKGAPTLGENTKI